MKMDVAIMTRNSARFLPSCLKAACDGVDINRLIIVDGGSQDQTLEIAEAWNAEIHHDEGGGLGRARRIAIKQVETPLFAFIDSDIEIPAGWTATMLSHAPEGFGAVESLPINVPMRGEEKVTATHNRATITRYKKITSLKDRTSRGFTGATILQTDLLKDIIIPDLPCCEDWVITQHILAKGYAWYKLPVPVKHHDRYSQRPDRVRQTHAVGRTLGFMTLPWLMKKTTTALLGRLVVSIVTRNPEYLTHRLRYTRDSFEGFLHPQRYLDLPYPGWEAA